MELEQMAFSTIHMCLANSDLYDMMEEKTIESLWKKLENLYMANNVTNRLIMKKDFYTYRMHEGEYVLDHIAQFNKTVSNLLQVGVIIDEEDRTLYLLVTLDSSFKHLSTTLLNR